MQLQLKKITPLRDRIGGESAHWIVQEVPGIVLMKNRYNRERSPLAPPDGWGFQGRWGEEFEGDRTWLRQSGLYTQFFPTRREALQALEAVLYIKPRMDFFPAAESQHNAAN